MHVGYQRHQQLKTFLITSCVRQTNERFVGMTSLLDGIVQHSCRTWSNTAAVGHYTHREASRNLELIPESEEMKLLVVRPINNPWMLEAKCRKCSHLSLLSPSFTYM